MLAPTLLIAILCGYAASLAWLLRREHSSALVWLVGLTGLSFGLRLIYTTEYPNGMNEDETKILWCTIDMLRKGQIFADDCTGIPAMLSVIFDAQLATWFGPTRWAIRGLSFLGGTLAVPAAYAAARSLGLRRAASLAAAGFVAVLPWALFYGRVHQSGELVLHTLLLVACLALFLRAQGGWQEILIGGFALTLLMQTYYSGRAMMGLAVVALVLAPGISSRLRVLGVIAAAAIGYLPYYLSGATFAAVGLGGGTFVQPGMAEDPIGMLQAKTWQALQALVLPVAYDQWLTIRAAAMHPWWLLALGVIGTLTSVRRFLFLWAGFAGGLAPSILGYSPLPSARRMLLAFPFICIAAACALDLTPTRRTRIAAAGGVFAITAFFSLRLFFSTDFWRPESAWVFDAARWNLAETLPPAPHERLIVTRDMGYYVAPRAALDPADYEILSSDNWYPPKQERLLYAFGPQFSALQGHYVSLFGEKRVRSFGPAFSLQIEENDWSWMREYGWSYEMTCGEETFRGQIPFLFLQDVAAARNCAVTPTHVWRGKWLGPPSELRILSRGEFEVKVDDAVVGRQQGWDLLVDFPVKTGSTVELRVAALAGAELVAKLTRKTPTGEQVPYLEWVAPLSGPSTVAAASP